MRTGSPSRSCIRHRQPDTRVVILTASNESALVGRATAAGAAGFLSKNGPLGDVLNAVHTAHGGGMTVSTDILARLLRSTTPVVGPRAGGLTAREHEVLELMAAGLDPRAIARRLGISVHTCRGLREGVCWASSARTASWRRSRWPPGAAWSQPGPAVTRE